MKSLFKLTTAAIMLAGFVATAPAQVIFNQDFQGGYTGAFGTSAYSGGSPTGITNWVISAGPQAVWQQTVTPTTLSDYSAGQLQLMTVSGNTDPVAADYVLSFDAYGSQAANIQFTIQSWQNNYFGGSQLISTTLNDQLNAVYTWQTFSVNLGTIAGANPTGATWQLAFQLNSWEWGGPGNFDQLNIDNVTLTIVPEPTTIALAGLGAIALLVFRRKV